MQSARDILTVLLVAHALGGCAFFARTFGPRPAAEPESPRAAGAASPGAFADLPPSDATPRGSSPAPDAVAAALMDAEHACAGEHAHEGPGEYAARGDSMDAFFVAWLHIDEAQNLARIAVEPLPEPRPVGIERQEAARTQRRVPPGELHLYAVNTRERYRVRLFDDDGRMRPEGVREITAALRDQRVDVARSPDPRLLVILYEIGQHWDAELEVISGYRVRNVNASEGSRHGAGAACDIAIDGVGIREIAAFVERRFAQVGVGYYPNSGFVHVDTRDTSYFWVDSSGPGQRSRTRTRTVDTRAAASDDPTLTSIHLTEEQLYQLPPSLSAFGYE
jgi:uncharacterized protein YcbK (DUF882 family)